MKSAELDPTRIVTPDEELLIPRQVQEKVTGANPLPYAMDKWKVLRQRARTNLHYLCLEVLGYKDVDPLHVFAHMQMLRAMQQFQGGIDKLDTVSLDRGTGYVPAIPMWSLHHASPERRTLVLASRGFLKSSVCTVAHSIQWIINYPSVRVLLSSGTGAQVSRFISIIVQHFRYNEWLRWLFPEFCPHGKEVKNFGSTEAMTIRQSIRGVILGEPTVSTISVGMVISGPHHDVHKHDDVVDKENVRTPTGLEQVTSHLQHTAPLLDRREGIPGWTDFIGTRYHYCLIADTRITMADWTQRRIADIKPGDVVVGWEMRDGKRYLRPSRVLSCGFHPAQPINCYTFASGHSVSATSSHRWWRGPWKSGAEYNFLNLGWNGKRPNQRGQNAVRRLLVPAERNESHDAGWLAGFFDGEGTVWKNRGVYQSGVVQITQTMHNPVLIERTRNALCALKFQWSEQWNQFASGNQDRCIFSILGGWRERYRFLAQVAPYRKDKLVTTLFAQLSTQEDKLVTIKDEGLADVYWLETETGNYIAEGLCSKNSDPYGLILDAERAKPKDKRTYLTVFAPAWTGRWGTEQCKPTWPARLPIESLKAIENDPLQGPDVLATQYGLRPRPGKSGLVESRDQIVFVPRSQLTPQFVASLRKHVTVDLHDMSPPSQANAKNDYTAITMAGFALDGHCRILNIYHGKPTPFEVIDHLFNLWKDFPDIVDFKIPKDMLTRVLLPFIMREQMKRQRFLPLVAMPVDNQISKPQKIRALQPWFRAGIISFADDIPCKQALVDEILRFPKYHDDILDTIRDQMENRNAGVEGSAMQALPPVVPQPPRMLGQPRRFIGFEEGTGRELWEGGADTMNESAVDRITGF